MMMPTARDLPIRPSEAAALADAVFQIAQEHRIGHQMRRHLAERIGSLGLGGLQAYAWSLTADPVETSGYYIAADANPNGASVPVLLYFALASAAGNGHFQDAALVGRLRPGGGREIAVSAIPFAPTDRANISTFLEHVDRTYLPRPQKNEPCVSAELHASGSSAGDTFEAFRSILAETGNNAAALRVPATRMTADALAGAYYAGVWAAIRAGWREGYSLEVDRISLPADPALMQAASTYTGFSVDASPMLDLRADHRSTGGWSEADVMRLYEEGFSPEMRSWAESEFGRRTEVGGVVYTFAAHEIRRLVVKFGGTLVACESAYDLITRPKEAFDFEIAIDGCETLTTAKEVLFCLEWMKARGRSVRSIAPNVGFKPDARYPENMKELVDYTRPKLWIDLAPRVAVQFNANPMAELTSRVNELSTVAAHFGAVLSIYGGRQTQAAAVQAIGRGSRGCVRYKVGGEADAQRLLDVARDLRT